MSLIGAVPVHHKRSLFLVAVVLILVGILLTLENFSVVHGVAVHWPVFPIIVGAGFGLLYYHRDQNDEALLWLGSFAFFLGLFFYYLNFTNWYQLGTLWPVFLGIVGLSFLSLGIVKVNHLFTILGTSFVGLFIVFTIVFTISLKLWPLSLTTFGFCLWIVDHMNRKRRMHG